MFCFNCFLLAVETLNHLCQRSLPAVKCCAKLRAEQSPEPCPALIVSDVAAYCTPETVRVLDCSEPAALRAAGVGHLVVTAALWGRITGNR